MSENELFFLELRISVLEDVLRTNPKLQNTLVDAYTRLKRQVYEQRPPEWETLLPLLAQQLERLSEPSTCFTHFEI